MKKLTIFAILFLSIALSTSFALPSFWYSGTAYNNLGQIIVSPALVELNIKITDGTNTYIENFIRRIGALPVNDFGVFLSK